MANINTQDYGIAGVQTDSFTATELFAGDTPAVVTDYAIVGALGTAGIAAWTPVHVDPATRAITLAVAGSVDPKDDVMPNAITVYPVPANTGATSNVSVYKAGMFNVDVLNWPSSFNTDALKNAAFAGSDCQIYVKKSYYG